MGHLKNFSKAEKQQHVYYYNSLGWAEAAKQKSAVWRVCLLLMWSHLIRFCFSLQNRSSFDVVIYIGRWNAGCQAKCEKPTTSRAHVVLFWPLGQYGSVTWGQDDLSDCNYMTSNSVDLLRSFLPYIKCIYQISKTNGQWQRNLNEFVKWRKKKKKHSLCAHATATTTTIASERTQTHKSRWKPSWVLTIGQRHFGDIWYPQSPSCCWWSEELPLIV